MKPLFIPLKAEYYDAFADGTKRDELRRDGPRWNAKTCQVGREVILSRGYGKQQRMRGKITRFTKMCGDFLSTHDRRELACVYGRTDFEVACIRIDELAPI